MSTMAIHDMLVNGGDLEDSIRRVRHFLQHNLLVRYESVEIDRERCCRGDDPIFAARLEQALAANRRSIDDLCRELRQAGYEQTADLARMDQGYQSKLLHTITHLLDGFFGIDSAFFDLDEGAHQLIPARRRQLSKSPHLCWLVRVQASTPDGPGFERQVLMPKGNTV